MQIACFKGKIVYNTYSTVFVAVVNLARILHYTMAVSLMLPKTSLCICTIITIGLVACERIQLRMVGLLVCFQQFRFSERLLTAFMTADAGLSCHRYRELSKGY